MGYRASGFIGFFFFSVCGVRIDLELRGLSGRMS